MLKMTYWLSHHTNSAGSAVLYSADVIFFLWLSLFGQLKMQVMWAIFVPFIPNSVLTGIISDSLAVAIVARVRHIILSCIKQFLFINSDIT
jgi:biotin transporter BioY